MKLIIRWAVLALTLILITYLVPGISVASFWSALVAALVFGLVNALIKPVVLILTLPINILTLGLFTFVINGLMLWLASTIVKGFDIAGFWAAFWGALALSVVSWLVNLSLKND